MFKHRRINWFAVAFYVVLIAGICAATYSFASKMLAKEPDTIEVEKEVVVEKIVEKEIVISGSTIESGISSIGKLCTAEYHFTHVESFEDNMYLSTGRLSIPGTNIQFKDLAIPGTKSYFIYSYDGKVLAGIDFEAVQVTKDDESRSITVILPAAEIISSSVDPESFMLYDEKNSIFNHYGVTEVADSFSDMIKAEENKAKQDGLLTEAADNAKLLVENFVRAGYNVGDYNVKVVFN